VAAAAFTYQSASIFHTLYEHEETGILQHRAAHEETVPKEVWGCSATLFFGRVDVGRTGMANIIKQEVEHAEDRTQKFRDA
jgi:hypothetical protein